MIGVGAWVMMGALADIAQRIKLRSVPLSESLRRLNGLPRSAIGTATAHFGVGVMVLGIVGTSAYQVERIQTMKPGDRIEVAGYTVEFKGVAPERGPNYNALVGKFDVHRGGAPVTVLEPGRRVYDRPQQSTSEAGIHASWRGDLYLVLGDAQAGDTSSFSVRVYFNPLVRMIWLGAVIMFVGGALSLSDRRLRVGAPRRARTRNDVLAPAE
jgi:cytochrome c-type biogenesis protein CcmF